MSLNSDHKGTAAAAGLQQLAPRLQSGGVGFAAWQTNMDVFLQRAGAEGIHRTPMQEQEWLRIAKLVEQWSADELRNALALVLAGAHADSAANGESPSSSAGSGSVSTGGATSTLTSPAALDEEQKQARKLVCALVDRSRRVYGVLFSALPEELRPQVEHIAQGWAYGLWQWLQSKFQSTEEDAVGALLLQWTSLFQGESESFDAYRARVNKLDTLLEQAKEKQSRRMYAFMLLERLQPRYKQAVLALKAGGQLRDANNIAWEAVTALINQHERSEMRMHMGAAESAGVSSSGGMGIVASMRSDVDGASSQLQRKHGVPHSSGWSQQSADASDDSSRGRHRAGRGRSRGGQRSGVSSDAQKCFRCDEPGHRVAQCPLPPAGKASQPNAAASSSKSNGSRHLASAATSSSNRFESLSSEEDDGDRAEQSERMFMAHSVAASDSREAFALTWAGVVKRGRCASSSGPAKCTDTPQQSVALPRTVPPHEEPVDQNMSEKQRGPREQQERQASKLNAQRAQPPPAQQPSPAQPCVHVATATTADASASPCSMTTAAKKLRAPVPLDVALADDAWGWDSMASACCSGNRERFITLRKCPAVPVKVADGNVVSATHVGSVALRVVTDSGPVVRIVIDDVLYDRRFASNLLSSELLTKKLGWQHHSTPDATFVVTPGGYRVTLSTRGRVAVLMGAGPERLYRALTPGAGSTTVADCASAASMLVRLHERLCHMGWTRMMNLLHGGKVEDHGIRVAALDESTCKQAEKRIRECEACVKGRATRTAFGHRGLDRGTQPGECIHLDTYQVRVERDGVTSVEYGLAMSDMYSAHQWHARLMSKDEVADRVIQLVTQAETQFGCVVKRIYSDGGTEFINRTLQTFCARTGKQLHWTPARSQQLNGAAERLVRTSKDHARMLLQHASAPVRLWSWAARHAAFVWNRTHIAAGTGMTPYEALRGKKPSMRHLAAVWGCDAYCHVPKEQRSALAAKAEPCIYVGHSEEQNAANVLLLSTRRIICSRDVTYRSDRFSFMRAIRLGETGVQDAFLTSEAELLAERDELADAEASSMPAQGGSVAADPSAPSDAASEPEEWTVESIVAQRQRHGRTEYKVRWAGYGSEEDSWEPESEVSDLAALDEWQAQQPAPRRSARTMSRQALPVRAPATVPSHSHHVSSSPSPSELPASETAHVSADQDEWTDEEPQVHMAMRALRDLQLPEEQPEHTAVMSAVAASVAALSLDARTPKTFREAMTSPDAAKWWAALKKEHHSCTAVHGVWTLVRRDQLPKGTNVLPCKEVFKLKVDESGQVTEHKARFTPKGFRQIAGVDYFETYARTGKYQTLRVALSLVAKWDHELAQFDVPTAFLNADVKEKIYMELPEGFRQEGMVCQLNKSLYGLKQAPRNWDRLVHTFITGDMAFKATVSDPSLYHKRSRSGRLMMIYRFVDDMQGSYHADDTAEFEESVALLQRRFNIKKLSTATWMLGMRIRRDRKLRTITLDQELYVSTALDRYGLQQCRPVSTPEAVGAAHDRNEWLDQSTDRQRYMEITGTLMYAAISTRPDITHSVHYLASNMQAPTQRHMLAAERVLRYLAGTKEVGLIFGSRNGATVGDSRGRQAHVHVDVCAFADADWANDKGDRRSVSGWVAKLNGDPVSWSSKKQRVVALSTCEAELYAEAAAIQEVLWLRGLMEELGLHTRTGSVIYGDNQSAIAVSQNGVRSERTKHVDVKYHFVTEAVERGSIQLRWVPTTQQQADIFTKALAAPVFELLRKQLMTR
jgi:transposase InsO family protein